MSRGEQTLPTPIGDEKIVYQGKFIEVVEQPMQVGEKELVYEFARRSPGVRLIIRTAEKSFLITKEYRTELEDWDYRLPGGKVFDSLDAYNQHTDDEKTVMKKAREAIEREAAEEAGIAVKESRYLGTSVCGATISWDLLYFEITLFDWLDKGQDLEQGEEIEVVELDQDELREICLSGRMQEDRSVAWLLRYLKTGEQLGGAQESGD